MSEERFIVLQATAQLLGNFGEFVGAIAVVATLAYLSVQVRHSTSATQAANRDTAITHMLSFFEQGLDNQVIARADHKKSTGQEIDDFEKSQLIRYQFYNFKILENIHAAYEQGVVAEKEWDYFRGIMKSVLNSNEVAVEMFENTRSTGLWWRGGFLVEIENLLSSP